MSGETNGPSAREQRVNEAIAAYLEAMDAGQAPDPKEFVAQNSDIAAELESFFANRDEFERMAEPLQPAGAAAAPEAQHDDVTLPPTDQPTEAPTLAPTETAGVAIGTMLRYFGDYELLDEIARGGMGVVYKARQVSLNRIVALKMILAGQLASEEDVQRFHAEAEAAANLDHPGIVPIFEVGEHEGQHYFSMGFVEGSSLSAKVADGPLPPREAAEYAKKVAEAVAFAHEKGVIHRDLKPANVLLDSNGEPKVTDFGLAKKVEGDDGLTATGQILGTPGYMPPEQASGKIDEVTATADVYSLGAILYCLLTARPPFQADNPLDTLMQVLEQEPVSPRTLNPKVPQDLETICLKCLDKDRHRRYASAKDLADELQRFINGEPILARPISTTARAWRWCKRKPALAITGALMVVATLAALLILVIAVVLVSASRQEAWTLAEANERLAKEELGLRKQAERDFVSLLFEQSHAQCRAEDAAEGILWLARSLEAAAKAETPDLEKAIRTQLAAWSPCVHPLKAVFRHPAPPGIIHQPSIDIVSFSPNGRILLTGNGAEVALWDSTTGTPIAPTLESPHLVDAAAFHPDGAVVATVGGGTTDGSSDGQMQLWTVETGKPKGPPCKHRGHVHSVAFSPDGKTVATASHTSHAPGAAELRLWESDTGKPMGPPLKHTGKITIIVFSPDGKFVLTGSGGVAQLWDVATGQHAIPPCKRDIFPVLCAAFGPNGKTIWTVDGFGAQRWDTATGQPMGEPIKLDVVDGVVLAPDAQKVLTYRSFSAQLLDLSTRKAIGPPLKHQKPIKAVAFSPDGKIAVTAGEDFTARLWDAASGKALGSPLKHRGGVQAVAISPDGTKVLTGGPESTARLWETPAARSTEQTLKRRSQIQAITASANHMSIGARVSFSSDRKSALTGSGNEARVWDVETGKVVAPVLGHQAKVQAVALSPDGKTALTICQNSTTRLWETRFWNVQTGKLLDSPVEHQERPRGIVFSPDGKTVATAWGLMGDAEARLWDVGTQRPVGSPLENQGTPIVFSPDGKIVATSDCTMDRYTGVRLWDVTTAEPIVPPLNHQGTIRAVAFSPDGQIVLTASVDNTARLWSVATGEPLLPALKHADDVGAVTLSPDGQLVLTGSGGAARLWETRTGEPVGPPFVHGGGVGVVAFSRDGNYVLTHGVNGARLWDLETRRTIGPALERESSITGDNLQMLLTVTPFDMVRLWNMREVMDSQAERLVLWTQVVTGMELDPNGGALVLDASAWNERSERLEELGREAVARQP